MTTKTNGLRMRCWKRICSLGLERRAFMRAMRKAGIIATTCWAAYGVPLLDQLTEHQMVGACRLLGARNRW